MHQTVHEDARMRLKAKGGHRTRIDVGRLRGERWPADHPSERGAVRPRGQVLYHMWPAIPEQCRPRDTTIWLNENARPWHRKRARQLALRTCYFQ
jgi:hypothetical protein